MDESRVQFGCVAFRVHKNKSIFSEGKGGFWKDVMMPLYMPPHAERRNKAGYSTWCDVDGVLGLRPDWVVQGHDVVTPFWLGMVYSCS
jgi:hypothetical protein